jgi:hypothetical protein
MADRKFYSIGFNLIDNFTTKYSNLKDKISKVTDSTHLIKIDVDKSVVGKTEEIGKKVSESTRGISKSIDKVSESNKKMDESTKKTTDSSKEHNKAIKEIKSGYEGIAETFSRVRTVAAGLFATLGAGAITMSWVKEFKTDKFKEQAFEILGVRNKRLNLDDLQEFANQARTSPYSGYTSGSTRTSIAYTLGTRGGRNTEQIIKATEGLEKTFLKYDELLEREHGISSSTELADVATRKVVGRYDKEWLDAIFGRGFSSKSQASRVRALSKVGVNIDVEAELNEDPLDEIHRRLSNIADKIGREMLGSFRPLAEHFAKFLRLLDSNPATPKILAIGVAFAAILGIVVTLIGAIPLLTSGLASVKVGLALLTQSAGLAKFSALLLGPYGILIAIGVILLVLAVKTGAFTAAWEKFSKSAIGTDIISGIQGIADVIGLVVDKFGEWYEATGRSQILTYFGYLVTVLGNAYDFMDKIYTLFKGSTGNPFLAGLAALASVPVALYAGGLKSATGIDATEILSGISDRIGSLSRWLTSNLPVGIEKITGFLSKLFSVINWIVNPFIRIFDIIKSLFEKVTSFLEEKFGLAEGDKEESPVEKAQKQLNWSDESQMKADIDQAKRATFDDKTKRFDMSDETMEAAWTEAATGIAQPHPTLYKESKYTKLVNYFKSLREEGLLGGPISSFEPGATTPTEGELEKWRKGEATSNEYTGSMVGGRWVTSEPADKSDFLGGLEFKNPKGESTGEKSSILDNLANEVPATGKAGDTIIVNNSPNIDLSGLKLSSDIDVDKLIKRFEDMIITGSTKAVKDALGQRRT